MKKIVLLAFVLMFFSVSILSTQIAVSGSATPDVYPGESIQDAINSAQPGDTIFVLAGTYYEHVVVNKTVSLIGEDGDTTIIDGNGTGIVVLVTANNVVIREFTVKNGNTGIYLDHSNDSTVRENNVIYNVDAIFVRFSNNCTIYQNLVGNNTHRGILVTDSWHFTISNNKVYGNRWYGINANASVNGVIVENEAYENYYDGIGLLNSNNCTVARNNVSDNLFFGIWLDSSDGNVIHHNNIINNGIQATATLSTNRWDDGVAGNYWSDYEDRYPNATELDGSGIWDTPYVIYENNQDNYPLVPEFPTWTSTLLILILLTVAIAIYKRRLLKTPIH